MLEILYRKMASYWYLRPYPRNHLDSSNALGLVQRLQNSGIKWPYKPVLEAGKHELVPKEHRALLELERRLVEAVEKIPDELILGKCPLVEE
jgi:hypothetical protein